MKGFSALVLFITLVVSVAVMFLPDGWVTSIPEAIPCLLAAGWMFRFANGGEKAVGSPLLIVPAFVAMLGLLQIATGTTVYTWQTSLSVLYWLGGFSVLFVATQSFSDRAVRNAFLRGLVCFAFLVAVVGCAQALTTDAKVYWTYQTKYTGWVVIGPFVYHSQYAAFVELVFPVALYRGMSGKAARWLYLTVAATLLASVFVAGSRAGLVLTGLEFLAVALVVLRDWNPDRRFFYEALGIFGVLAIVLVLAAGPGFLLRRLSLEDPYAIRREFLESSLAMFRQRPLLGFGLGNWPTVYPGFALFDDGLFANQAHNDWAQWAVEGGIPMLGAMLAGAVWIFPRAIRTGWGCGVAAVLLHCAVDYPIQRPAVALAFFAMAGAVSCSRRANNRPGHGYSPEG